MVLEAAAKHVDVQRAFPTAEGGIIVAGLQVPPERSISRTLEAHHCVWLQPMRLEEGWEHYDAIAFALSPNAEQQALTLTPMLATQYMTFEVHVFGCAPNYGAAGPDPDYGDFDATLNLVYAFWSVVFDQFGGGASVLHERWPSQEEGAGSMTQRGQHWMGIVEFEQNVTRVEKQFVPIGVSGQFTVQPVNPASGDPIVIDIS